MAKYRWFFIILLFVMGLNANAQESGAHLLGVKLPDTMILDASTEKLVLNGYAASTLWGKEVYVAALYTPKVEHDPHMLLLNKTSMAMVLYFVQDDITAQMLVQIFTEGIFVNNPKLNYPKQDKGRLLELQAALNRGVNAGDVLTFQYSVQTGELILFINNKEIHRWNNAKTFFNMILRMWIGNFPPSREFKQEILGIPPA